MRLDNLDRALELRRNLHEADLAIDGVKSGVLHVSGWFSGEEFNVKDVVGVENVRAALLPALAYARSQIIAELTALGIEVPTAAHGGKEG